MNIQLERTTTAGQLVAEILERYGSRTALARHVRGHPKDAAAKVALHDLDEYRDEDPGLKVREGTILVFRDADLDALSARRFSLLVTLGSQGGTAVSVRALARMAGRDVKNVSEDLKALSKLGLVRVEANGRGRPAHVALAGDSIRIELTSQG